MFIDSEVDESAWQNMLPTGVSLSAGFEPRSVTLSLRERLTVKASGPARRREFATGRLHARRALSALGFGAVELPRGGDGAPAWPPGVVGSISHTLQAGQVFAVAAVADAAVFPGLGVDVEAPGTIPPRLWPTVFRPVELDALLRLPVPRRVPAASMLWSAKEAAVKACRNRVGLERMTITRDPMGSVFAATSDCGSVSCVGCVVEDRGWVLSMAWLRRSDNGTPFDDFFPSAAARELLSIAASVTPSCAGSASRRVITRT